MTTGRKSRPQSAPARGTRSTALTQSRPVAASAEERHHGTSSCRSTHSSSRAWSECSGYTSASGYSVTRGVQPRQRPPTASEARSRRPQSAGSSVEIRRDTVSPFQPPPKGVEVRCLAAARLPALVAEGEPLCHYLDLESSAWGYIHFS
eukprot:SAG11_NODE_427_length_9558_cov_4.909398_10_plen_149_part_00